MNLLRDFVEPAVTAARLQHEFCLPGCRIEVPVEPQVVVVREPQTTLVPSILPPFLPPVTTYGERTVCANGTYVSPSYRVVDEDGSRVLRPYAPETDVVRC